MKVLVIGGTGLIGRQVVARLREQGHEAVAAWPSSGVNAVTGEGLDQALVGVQVVVDVSNSPSFEDGAVLKFFESSTTNLLKAEAAAGVAHHVALSVVGADRIPDSGYMRAKVAQEKLIQACGVPYTILRATQFFEFVGSIVEGSFDGASIRLPSAMMQPIASADVASAVADVALAPPANGIVDLAGPEPIRMDDLARRYLAAKHDSRPVTTDPSARYFGAAVDDRSLVPGGAKRLGAAKFDEWLRSSQA